MHTSLTRFLFPALVGCLLSGNAAWAFPSILDAWMDAYPQATLPDDLTAATGAPCQLCHVNTGGGEPWNQYGFAVLSNGGASNVPQAFFDIEAEDADGESTTNLDEITANTLPGWCESANPGCENLAWTRSGSSSPATPPAGVTLDPPPGSLAPTANSGGPYGATVGTPIQFDASASSDPDGIIISWDWDFGDGNSASGELVSHAYASEGEYIVSVTVTDSDALSDTASTTATVVPPMQPIPPVADAGGVYGGEAGAVVSFDGSASFDPDGSIVGWIWSFGDGSFASGAQPTHVFTAAGEYTVRLRVTDSDGLRAIAATSATITDPLGEGEAIYRSVCQNCHGDPWDGPAVDPSLVAGRRNTGARVCSIDGAINGNFVFPGGVPEMQFLQGVYTAAQIAEVSAFLNSRPVQQQRRYITTCAGCHGNDARGGRVGENIRGETAADIREALVEKPQMRYLQCLPDQPDVVQIGRYLSTLPGGAQ